MAADENKDLYCKHPLIYYVINIISGYIQSNNSHYFNNITP